MALMMAREIEASWEEEYQQVMEEMVAWRKANPRATFRQIEQTLDERLNRLRAKMLEDAVGIGQEEIEGQAVCPDCGQGVRGRGKKKRRLQTQGDESVTLEREHAICTACGRAFFPPG
jgi:DNA repair exonuclease SbcCD ATPase subunit